jgi:translation initiation factor RLI1
VFDVIEKEKYINQKQQIYNMVNCVNGVCHSSCPFSAIMIITIIVAILIAGYIFLQYKKKNISEKKLISNIIKGLVALIIVFILLSLRCLFYA